MALRAYASWDGCDPRFPCARLKNRSGGGNEATAKIAKGHKFLPEAFRLTYAFYAVNQLLHSSSLRGGREQLRGCYGVDANSVRFGWLPANDYIRTVGRVSAGSSCR
jgi:hypothetical protein